MTWIIRLCQVALILAALWLLFLAAMPAGAQPVTPCATPIPALVRPLPQTERAAPNVARGGTGREMPSGGIPPKERLP